MLSPFFRARGPVADRQQSLRRAAIAHVLTLAGTPGP